jgi:hypothetical protein
MKDKYYEKYVDVMLHEDNILNKDVLVSVEGEMLLVPRGKWIRMKRKFAIALVNMEAHKVQIKPSTNYDRIKNKTIPEMAEFLKSLLDGENNHNVGCYGCSHYGTHHSDIKNKGTNLYECDDCSCEGVGLDLVKWLENEAE